MQHLSKIGIAYLLSALAATASHAAWPDKPIRLIQPYAPGGTTDILARIIGEEITAELGQPVVVEGRTGAGGNIALEAVSRAKPDGYTLLMATNANFAVNPHLYKNLTFNPLEDFAPISQVVLAQNMLVVHPSLPVNSVAELIQYAKANPGKLAYGSSGTGSLQHLTGELFQRVTDTKMVHIPYKGGGPARMDLVGGHIELMFGDLAALPLVAEGKLRALAVTGAAREPGAMSVPTLQEAGLDGVVVEGYYFVAAPAGTPGEVVERISKIVAAALQKEEIRRKIVELGVTPSRDASPEHLAESIKAEHAKWAVVISETGIKLD